MTLANDDSDTAILGKRRNALESGTAHELDDFMGSPATVGSIVAVHAWELDTDAVIADGKAEPVLGLESETERQSLAAGEGGGGECEDAECHGDDDGADGVEVHGGFPFCGKAAHGKSNSVYPLMNR